MGNQMNTRFQHMFNSTEKRLGGRRLPVDGYGVAPDGKETVLQFFGCYFHSHMCQTCKKGKYKTEQRNIENLLETLQNVQYLRDLGYDVRFIWECEFERLKETDDKMREFITNLDFLVDRRYKLSQQQIIKEVESGKMFGMVEVDLETPPEHYRATAEFQPVIKRVAISRDDIGDHMRKFAEDNGLLKRPSETLICSYFAKKILLATPLLQWYLNHGLKVTKVYQVIQYKPAKCFARFGQEVMAARREGDVDPSKQIISASSKLMGE